MGGQSDDAGLMLAFAAGDSSAFETLFQRWAGPLLRFLERMIGDSAAAEELVQEAFLRVHRARDRYRPEARFSTWLYRIATNLALNELRRPRERAVHRSSDEEGAPELPSHAVPADRIVDARRASDALETELQRLPERQRAALWMTSVEGFSYAEVAEALDASEGAVKSLVHRARSTLADQLRERGVAVDLGKGD